MTIEHYRFRPGAELKLDQDLMTQMRGLMRDNQPLRRVLAAGEYDLTPDVWKRYGSNRYNYNLLVHEDGTATIRLIPVDQDSITYDLSVQGIQAKQGGRTFRVPQDGSVSHIAGPQRGDPTIRVFNIINFTPGPSPKSSTQENTK